MSLTQNTVKMYFPGEDVLVGHLFRLCDIYLYIFLWIGEITLQNWS